MSNLITVFSIEYSSKYRYQKQSDYDIGKVTNKNKRATKYNLFEW